IGRIGSCVPRQFISALLAPHCWNATSFADPEYVMDLTSPNAFWALAMTVLASCAIAFPANITTWARPSARRASFLTTDSSLYKDCRLYSGDRRVESASALLTQIWPPGPRKRLDCSTPSGRDR